MLMLAAYCVLRTTAYHSPLLPCVVQGGLVAYLVSSVMGRWD